jgi:hypothetical protein
MEDKIKVLHRSYLFTIRIWMKEAAGGQPGWYGKAQFIPTGETFFFTEWPALLSFIEKKMPGKEGIS